MDSASWRLYKYLFTVKKNKEMLITRWQDTILKLPYTFEHVMTKTLTLGGLPTINQQYYKHTTQI